MRVVEVRPGPGGIVAQVNAPVGDLDEAAVVLSGRSGQGNHKQKKRRSFDKAEEEVAFATQSGQGHRYRVRGAMNLLHAIPKRPEEQMREQDIPSGWKAAARTIQSK